MKKNISTTIAGNIFRSLFPTTELGIDLKLLTRKRGRIGVGDSREGRILHDEDDHFTFIEDVKRPQAQTVVRNPLVYKGKRINVHQTADGAFYPTLKRPAYTEDFGFVELCREAAVELIEVACLVEED